MLEDKSRKLELLSTFPRSSHISALLSSKPIQWNPGFWFDLKLMVKSHFLLLQAVNSSFWMQLVVKFHDLCSCFIIHGKFPSLFLVTNRVSPTTPVPLPLTDPPKNLQLYIIYFNWFHQLLLSSSNFTLLIFKIFLKLTVNFSSFSKLHSCCVSLVYTVFCDVCDGLYLDVPPKLHIHLSEVFGRRLDLRCGMWV